MSKSTNDDNTATDAPGDAERVGGQGMTENELRIVAMLGDVWNLFHGLPEEHPVDRHDFMHGVHVLQNIVLARDGRRQMQAILSASEGQTG